MAWHKNCVKQILPFESPFMNYLTPFDSFYLVPFSRYLTSKVFRVWPPWPLTFRGHLRSKIFPPFESPYTTSYLTSFDMFSLFRTILGIFDFSLSRTVFEKIRVKVLRAAHNGGFWPFQGQGRWPIFFILEKGLILAKRRRMTYCASKSVQPFWLHPHQRAWKV